MKKLGLAFMFIFILGFRAFAAPVAPPTPTPTAAPTPAPTSSTPQAPSPSTTLEQSFLEKYPHLKQNLYKEPSSNIYLGFSAGLVGVLSNRMLFTANVFQIHYLTHFWDNEILSISYGVTTGNPTYIQSSHFIFRTIPKYRINRMLSLGPLLGYEFVSFPQITGVLEYKGLATEPEPFSSSGVIYGVGVSENIDTDKSYKIKINQLIYQQTYSTDSAGYGWSYLYDLKALRNDTGPIKAGTVFLLEVGMLF